MSKKQEFIKYVKDLIKSQEEPIEMSDDVKDYWNAFCSTDSNKPMFTDNGKLILKYMQEHMDTPMWKAKDVAEGLFISSRGVSGAMRKLVTDGYVEKVGQEPVIYSLTDQGKTITID